MSLSLPNLALTVIISNFLGFLSLFLFLLLVESCEHVQNLVDVVSFKFSCHSEIVVIHGRCTLILRRINLEGACMRYSLQESLLG
jgi:hypothetical protein